MRVNPSRWSRRIVISLVAAVAVSIATYMGLYQLGIIDSVYDPVFGSQTEDVLNSHVSHVIRQWLHIPDALLGAFAYFLDIVFALIGSSKRWKENPWLVMLFGFSIIPVGIVSIILVILQGTVIGAWCFPCFITASISLILIPLSYSEVRASYKLLRKQK